MAVCSNNRLVLETPCVESQTDDHNGKGMSMVSIVITSNGLRLSLETYTSTKMAPLSLELTQKSHTTKSI